jgi:hypothetical protein
MAEERNIAGSGRSGGSEERRRVPWFSRLSGNLGSYNNKTATKDQILS